MNSITSISVNSYAVSSPNVITGEDDKKSSTLIQPVEEAGEAGKELRVDSASANINAVDDASDPIKALKEQIEAAQKLLAEQQAQLASAQRGKGTEEQKAQEVMQIQNQIAITASNLQVLQAALLQAMFSVDVHA